MTKTNHFYRRSYSGYKVTLLVVFVFLLPRALLAHEALTFVAERNITAFNWSTDETIVVAAGDHITTYANVGYGTASRNSDESHLTIVFEHSNGSFSTLAKYFLPANTEDVFDVDIFIDYPMDRAGPGPLFAFGVPASADVDHMWVPLFYADILMGQNRSMLLEIRPGLAEPVPDEGHFSWYEHPQANLQNGRAMFYNAVIRLGYGTHLAVRNIRRTYFGYVVDCVVSAADRRWEGWLIPALAGTAFWDAYNPGDAVTLLLHLDGDYLDIYTAGSDLHVGTFIRAGREFIAQYQSLIRTNTSDLTNVQWPRRADGSMDIPPPDALNGFQATHTTSARLNVRSGPSTDSPLVTTLEAGTAVQVLETGPQTAIGGTIAPWVRVVTRGGYTGWCFSGFLITAAAAAPAVPPLELAPGIVPLPLAGPGALPPAVPVAANVPPLPEAESGTLLTGLPWVWFMLAGGVLAGAAVLAVMLGRRKAG